MDAIFMDVHRFMNVHWRPVFWSRNAVWLARRKPRISPETDNKTASWLTSLQLIRDFIRIFVNKILSFVATLYLWLPDSAPACYPTTYMPPMRARFMGPAWGPSGADRTQVGPMLAPWTLLTGTSLNVTNIGSHLHTSFSSFLDTSVSLWNRNSVLICCCRDKYMCYIILDCVISVFYCVLSHMFHCMLPIWHWPILTHGVHLHVHAVVAIHLYSRRYVKIA